MWRCRSATFRKDVRRDDQRPCLPERIQDLQDGKGLQTLYVSDDDEAIILKRFERGAMTREVLEEIKEGDYVEAYGNVVNDDFLSDIVFMPSLVKKVDPPAPRMDDAPQKRVELHLHTNFSEMDGVCDIAEYIKTADAGGWMPSRAPIILSCRRSPRRSPLWRREQEAREADEDAVWRRDEHGRSGPADRLQCG